MKLTLAIVASLCLVTGTVSASQHPEVNSVMSKVLTDFPGKEVTVLTVKYPPGGADPIHRHNAHAFVYVLEGSIVMQVRGSDPVTLTAGQTFYEAPNDVHIVGRNASKTKPAKFVVFLLKDQAAPALIPVE
jgi:quercetin dioxygenase-like cupin family protein